MRQFELRLALKSGFWAFNPDLMLALMPQRVYREWIAYSELEPWDEGRSDWRAARIAYTVATSNWSGKGRRPRFEDFMPKFEKPRTAKTPKSTLAAMKHMVKLFGGEIKDNRPEWKKQRDGPL